MASSIIISNTLYMHIQDLNNLVKKIETEYILEAKKNEATRWLQDFNKEIQEVKQYREREILELLQNADDAGSSLVKITLDSVNHILTITNGGPGTIPFTEDGVKSIMYANVSPKKGAEFIGAKGLGFRSVLNWAEQITIISENIEISFSPDRVEEFWNQSMDLPEATRAKYEVLAGRDHRKVPLALLSLPSIKETPTTCKHTSIILRYYPEREELIRKELLNFAPTCLLFLHNIKHIIIVIDGETVRNEQNYILSDHDGITTSMLAGERWVMKRLEGKEIIDGIEKRYEAGCAYCLDNKGFKHYPLHDFFPTHQDFGLPCVLHATIELNSSRTEMIVQDPTNELMMKKLASVISDVADYLKNLRVFPTWDAHRLMRPSVPPFETDAYKVLLFQLLNAKKGAYVPLLGKGYGIKEECWYLNDTLYDLISYTDAGTSIFGGMRRKEAHGIHCPVSEEFSSVIRAKFERFAQEITDYDLLARYILELRKYGMEKGINLDCHVFKGSEGKIIDGRAYINEGQKAEEVPSFLSFEYMNQNLAKALKDKMVFSRERPWQREMADKLSIVGEVSASDISSITSLLVPKSRDYQRPEQERRELITALFKIFLKRENDFSIGDSEAWLSTDAGTWQRASMLVMTDKRFPDGFNNLGINTNPYPLERCVKYPDYLEDLRGSSPSVIQEFFVKLGVNLYFTKNEEHYGEDREYINSLNIPEEVKYNCSWKDKKHASRNMAKIADRSVMSSLKLNDLLKIIKISGYYEEVCGRQKINWYHKGYKTPVTVDLSYAAYLLQKNSAASVLKYYAVEDGEWLPGMMPIGISPFDDTPLTQAILYALGAVRRWSDCSSDVLYQALQIRTTESEEKNDPTGLKTFYHKIKQALNENDHLTPPEELRLACRLNDDLCFLPAKEIYYSDNLGVRSLRKRLPMLEMSSREGEDIVKRVFGCRLFKDIKTVLLDEERNEKLTYWLNLRLQMLKPYLIAFASKNAGSRGGSSDELLQGIGSSLDRLSIQVVSRASYSIEKEGVSSDERINMENGDLQYFDGVPTLCSSLTNESEALADPHFCNAVVETIGIALKLRGSENMDRFHRLLKSSPKELEYIKTTEYDESVWARCVEIAGVSQSELLFWREVFKEAGIEDEFDETLFKKVGREYLVKKLGISVSLANMNSFSLHPRQQLLSVRANLERFYLSHIHKLLSESGEEAQGTYVGFKNEFCSGKWIEDLYEEIKYQVNPDYYGIVKKYIADRFDFDVDTNGNVYAELPPRHDEYLLGHDLYELNLSSKNESLLYFDGKEEYFRCLIEGQLPQSEDNEDNNGHDSFESIEQSDPISVNIIETVVNNERPGRSTGQGPRSGSSRPSDRDKRRAGQVAEDLVLKALKSSDDFEVGMIYSQYLAPKEGQSGDDSKGYDLEYRRKGELLYRCLEIKNCPSGEEIILTSNEYDASQKTENRDRYDIALVTGNCVNIWQNALSNQSSFTLLPEGYKVRFKIKDRKQ